MKVLKRLTAFLAALTLVFGLAASVFADDAPDIIAEPEITAESALVLHLESGTVLFEKNKDERCAVAFLPKVMTVLLALEKIEDLSAKVTVNASAFSDVPDMQSDKLQIGEEIRAVDLLYCVMTATSNRACNVLAEYIAGSKEAFVEMMNERAKELGAVDTLFTCAHGIPIADKEPYNADDVQHTTASDAAKIVGHALTVERFLMPDGAANNPPVSFEKISDAVYHVIEKTNKQARRELYGNNRFRLSTSSFYASNVTGIKTSITTMGYSLCAVKEATLQGLGRQKLLALCFRSDGSDSLYGDMNAVWRYCFENYRYVELIGKGQIAKTVDVKLGSGADRVNLISDSSLSGFILGDYNRDKLEYAGEVPESVTAPVEKGDKVCELEIIYDGKSYGAVGFSAAVSIERDELEYLLSQISGFFSSVYVRIFSIVVILFIIFYIIYAVIYNKKKRRGGAKKVKNRFKF